MSIVTGDGESARTGPSERVTHSGDSAAQDYPVGGAARVKIGIFVQLDSSIDGEILRAVTDNRSAEIIVVHDQCGTATGCEDVLVGAVRITRSECADCATCAVNGDRAVRTRNIECQIYDRTRAARNGIRRSKPVASCAPVTTVVNIPVTIYLSVPELRRKKRTADDQ